MKPIELSSGSNFRIPTQMLPSFLKNETENNRLYSNANKCGVRSTVKIVIYAKDSACFPPFKQLGPDRYAIYV